MGVCSISLSFFSSLLTHYSLSPLLYLALGLATFSVYQLYWLFAECINEKIGLFALVKNNIRFISFLTFFLAFSLFLFLQFQLVNVVFTILVIFIFIYFYLSKSRHFELNYVLKGFVKTVLLAIIWTIATSIFPFTAFELTGKIFTAPTLHRFLFMLILSVLFDIRDKNSDNNAGRKTIATVLTERQVNLVLFCMLSIFIFISLFVLPINNQGGIIMCKMLEFTPVLLCLAPLFRLKLERYYYWAIDGLMIYTPLVFYISLL